MFGERLRERRQASGLTQAALAARAGVSRQLVGAVETGRHLPRVDAALALATALGVTVEALTVPDATPPAEPVTGAPPRPGAPVRAGRVGERLVVAPLTGSQFESWPLADGVVGEEGVELLEDARPGAVVLGCDPALGLAASLVNAGSSDRLLAVASSTADALAALVGGRAHGAVVHGRDGHLPRPEVDVARWHLSRWQVGIAAPPEASASWVADALTGRAPVIQRRAGAGTQAAFERAAGERGDGIADGPLVEGHVEAAWLASRTGLAAVTIEPAALAAGLHFHPLETHVAELWVLRAWLTEPAVRRLGEAFTSPAVRRRLAAVGGYDLTGCGTPLT